MKDDSLDKIILGENQFFGINHLSAARGAATAQYFNQIDRIIDIVRYAYSKGAGGLMLTTHPLIKDITAALRKDKELTANLNLYILLPYMMKYIRSANEKGLVNVVLDTLSLGGWTERLSIALKGGGGILGQDAFSMIKAFIDIELLPYKGLRIKAVFLHNALTDLAAALDLSGLVKCFDEYISKEHKTSPAYCTLTSGLSMRYLQRIGIENPIVMAPFNPAGFQMSPSKEGCEKALREIPARVIAMSTLACGYVKPDKASAYLATLPEIKSVVVGASSRAHIDESFGNFERILK